MKNKPELWKDVKKWEGIYQISDHGRLKSFKQFKHFDDGYILSLATNKWGYSIYNLTAIDKKTYHVNINVLVAKHFIKNPLKKTRVINIDLNKKNSHANNLKWVTRSEEKIHAVKYKGQVTNLNIYNTCIRPKIVMQYSLDGDLLNKFANCKEASISTGVEQTCINRVALGQRYQAGGFDWRFQNDN